MCKHARPSSLSRRAAAWSASFRLLRASAPVVVAVSASVFVSVGTPRAQAQDSYTYTGTTGTADAPTTSTTFTGAFTDTTTGTPNTTPAATDNTLTFGGSASYAATDDIASLTLNGGLAFTNTAGTVTINAANGATIFGSGAGSTLGFAVNTGVVVFNPAISLGASTLAFTGGGTGSQTTIGGVISGTGAMTDSIAGTLTLSANNTYTGGTTVNSGSTLVLNAGGGAGAIRGAVTVNTGATLSLNVNNALGYTAGTQVTALNINGGTVSVAGNQGDEGFLTSFNLTGGTLAYAGTGAYQIAAGDATAPKITSNASPTTSLISGGVYVRSGNLPIIVASGTTTSGVDLMISGVIAGAPITKSGNGLLALSNFNTYTGGTTVNAGTLRLAAGGGSGAVQGAITVNSGATLNLSVGDAVGYGAGTSVTTINVNGGTVTSGNFNEGYLTSYNLTGGTVAAGGLFRFNVNATAPPTISSSASGATSFFNANIDDFASGGATPNSNLTVNVATGNTANGVDLQIGGAIITNGGLAKTNSGYLNLTGQSTFTGPVNVTAGTLNIGTGAANNGSTGALGLSNAGKAITVSQGATLTGTAANWFGNNGNTGTLPAITVNGGTLSTFRYTTLGALALNGATVTATSSDGTAMGSTGKYQAFAFTGNVTVGGSAASSISSTNVTATSGGYHLGANTTFTVATTGAATPDLTVSAPLINQSADFGQAAGGLTKSGAGVMALNATNTYTGATTVNGGTLLVNGSTAGASTVAVGTATANTGTLGGTGTVGGATTVAAGGTITGATNGTVGALTLQSTLTINGGTFAVDISGATADMLTISGVLSLTNANITFNGTPTAPSYILATYASEAGTFAGTAPSGYSYQFNPNGMELDLVAAAVPEPATWIAGFLLLGTVGWSQRRKLNGRLGLARA